ncbi:MAG: mechanosensitive ion channel family protein [Chloroflexota bacterium]|nr:mechanosensitive ion channel family protein [Chloroflexota bacterium]MBI5703150.1 mechanosensitive ion channel family protein [Chloroflexota bacterium]
MGTYFDTFIENFIRGIPNLLTALAIFVVSLYAARGLSRVVRRVLERRKAVEGVTHLLADLTRVSVIAVGAITALQRFFDVTAFLAGLGIIGFTVGFALQDVMKNFAAGVILLIQQPFQVDEVIGTAGFEGTVLRIDMRSTELKALDGRIVSIPNAEILAHPIVNYTRAERRRVELPVGVGYAADTDAARRAVLEAIRQVPGFVAEPAPMVGFSNFGDSALELIAYFWIDAAQTNPLAAKDAALSLVKEALEEENIEIPFFPHTAYMPAPVKKRTPKR